jgi:membrane-associated phospholipid phosphatase
LLTPDPERKLAKSWDSEVPLAWIDYQLKLVRTTPGFTPPNASRAFAYTGVALYESIKQSTPNYNTLIGQLSELDALPQSDPTLNYNWPIVANTAMAQMTRLLFANAHAAYQAKIDSIELAWNTYYTSTFALKPALVNRSKNHGLAVANAVFQWSTTDGGHESYNNVFPSSFTPPTGDGLWIPTPPGFAPIPLLPYWGNNRLMVPANASPALNPPPPPAFSTDPSSVFYQDAMLVYNEVVNTNAEKTLIAQYWADFVNTFTPPGHMMAIARQEAKNKNYRLDRAAKLFCQMGLSLYDASILCWKCKYEYNLIRPVSYIKNYIDPNWNTLIITPPFPAYTSGHSTFSAAMASIMTSTFGANYAFVDESKIPYGFAARAYPNFYAAANEAKMSRLYGGIHYTFDNEEGFNCGQAVGNNVINLNW